ncbi:type II toxin-antitoxin system VapC family toxin [Candidatus Electronema sp. JM]|uniref:type II toxin-antitoxin system VapC family toxin n=1 Tax=Candidatus Electronema sp. JM TaxID=3401571 RepID=UPI003AA8CB11
MKILLDTHAFIWWDSDISQLSPTALQLCQDPANTLLLSAASLWEMQIKQQLGKLKLKLSLREIVQTQQESNGLIVLPVQLAHVLLLEQLPLHHRDPFDRLLIAQANAEQAALLSCDSVFGKYQANVIW